jgi:hypothetical protein
MPTFNSPRKAELILTYDNGARSVTVAERARGNHSNLPHWDLAHHHQPSGQTWPGTFNGNAIIDAMGELCERKAHVFHTHSGHPLRDKAVPVRDDGSLSTANITRRQGFGRAAAARARGDE